MSVIYQLTFFLALGLLAIVVTVFVFAVSQVGRATESTSREQEEILSRQKDAKKGQVERIQKQLDEAKQVGEIDESKIANELVETENELAGYEAQLEHLQKRIMLIRRKGAVIYPGACFLLTLALSITASGLAEAQNLPTLALWLWITSVGILAFGIYRMLRTLGAIEEVTVTSQEAVEKLPEAVKLALREIEAEKKPKLNINLANKTPLRMAAESEMRISFILRIESGDIAREVGIFVHAPSGFEFLPETVKCAPIGEIGGVDYVSARLKVGNFVRGTKKEKTITLKSPSKPDNYTVYYRCFCEGYSGESVSTEVVIE